MNIESDLSAARRPLVVYWHRYPIELEAVQYPAARLLLDQLLVKYDVLYVSMQGVRPPDAALRKGLRILQLPLRVDQTKGMDKWIKTALYYAMLPWAIAKVRALHPAFILCKETLPWIPSAISRLQAPMMISTSDWWWSTLLGGNKWGRSFAAWMECCEVRQWNRAGAYIASTSRAEARLVEQRGMDAQRIRVINAPFPRGVYHPCEAAAERARLGFGREDWVLAIHGIIRPGKGYGQLLEWWKRTMAVHPKWRLLIIGGAGGETWCRDQIRRMGLEKQAIMTGWLPTQEEVNRYLNVADALLVVRRNSEDNKGIIPSALFHSLATGKPTVATGLPGMAEVIQHGVTGYLFEPDNYESFLNVLEHVAAHRDEAGQIGKAGYARAQECFDPETAACRHVEWIDEILTRSLS